MGQEKEKREIVSPYDRLLKRIILGDYAPGTSLVEQELANEFHVSRTPIRQALIRLEQEGLVHIVPRRGIRVTEASVRLIRDVTEVRLILEDYLAHLIIERVTETWVEGFRNWLKEIEPTWKQLSYREWLVKDEEFHVLLYEAAKNSVLANYLRMLRRQTMLFWGQSDPKPELLVSIIEDYRKVLRAVERRSVKELANALRAHCLDHVERMRDYMKPHVSTRIAEN